MFEFRIFYTADGNQIIDETLKTPYNALTPAQMLEYMETYDRLTNKQSVERKRRREIKRKNSFFYKLKNKIAYVYNMVV